MLHAEKDFVAVGKPAGVLTHRTPHSEGATLADLVAEKYPEIRKVGDEPSLRPGVVHRLDKDTSGVILFARNQPAFEYLKKCFQEGRVRKTYLALVWGKTKERGIVDAPIGLRSGSVRRSVLAKNMKMVKPAHTEYETMRHFTYEGEDFSLLYVYPKTGRTHQIRVHMAHIGHGLVGDPLYMKRKNPFGLARQFLHAEKVEFQSPTGKRVSIQADLPPDLKAVLSLLTN